MKIRTISHQDIQLEVREAGAENGKLMVLLHGFPECWSTWRHQIAPLVQAGFRVVVPNMRGYGRSSKPKDYRRYHLDKLITDVEAIRLFYQAERFHLVGHDWGGAVAWWYALHHEAKLYSLSVLNLPHPLAFLTKLKGSPAQMLKSWYMFYFQIPFLPEFVLKIGRFAILKKILKASSTRHAYDAEDFRLLEEAWREPGAIQAMVNYYRALLRNLRLPESDGTLHLPVQILWGEKDLALSVQGAHDSMRFLKNGTLTLYPDATHWLAHDKPEEISRKLIDHALGA